MLVALVVSAARPPGPAAQPRRPEILRLATAYELYGGLWRLTAAARGPKTKARSTADNVHRSWSLMRSYYGRGTDRSADIRRFVDASSVRFENILLTDKMQASCVSRPIH